MVRTSSQLILWRFSQRASECVVAIGVTALLGWLLDVPLLRSWNLDFKPMNPLSAVLLVLIGGTLRLTGAEPTPVSRPSNRWIVTFGASIVVVLGALKLIEYLGELDLNVDQWLFHGRLNSAGPYLRNEMALNTALNFVLCGAGLLLLDFETRRGFRPAQVLFLIAALLGLLALIGYVYRSPHLYTIGTSMPMALNSAVAFELFCLAALGSRPDRGWMGVITSDTTAGVMARRLLPAAILIPLGLGALEGATERSGYLKTQPGLALFATAVMILFAALIWWNARLLFFAETEKQKAEAELKRTSAELARSNTDLQQFAYVASHDLTEPLRMVVSYLQLVKGHDQQLDSEGREFIGYAMDGAARMQALIQDLLAYARVDVRGNAFEPIEADNALRAALANLKVPLEETHAGIEREPLPRVRADAVQLTQVFQNLIGNAVKFRGQTPLRIEIGARRQGDEWIFHVRDNGIGIEPKHFDRVFALFQRLHTRREYPGTGMGLAICKKIVERHGGRIWVESTPGKGAAFFFTLPAA